MNYKVMKRPMFRLGGDVRKNYQNGTGLAEIQRLIGERAAARDKLIGGMRTMMPLQVLAGQPGLQTIRKPTDVLSLLSDIGQDPNLFNALMRSQSLDLKMKEGELTDKITLEKLKQSKNKKFEFEKRLDIASNIEKTQKNLLAGKSEAEQKTIRGSDQYRNLEKRKNSVLREMSEADFIFRQALENPNTFDIEDAKKLYDKITSGLADGGRVGYQEGTPEPMMKETISVEETLNPVKEQPQESTMSVKQMYDLMRQRIPQANVSDKDLYKIASSEQIMADFASLETMSDVTQFNEQYDTNIVLDLPIVG
jgi:hypothetical protein